ncbi:MAG: hypothetical protein QNJ55_20185 [Xenococcus sp. MO_188.B8]|nr:hypothetical protein [Xenococcus sp. MO_188.B8]
MNDTIAFVVKILIFSTLLSVLIKYGGQLLSINPTVAIVIMAILLPTIIVAVALGWRSQKKLSIDN